MKNKELSKRDADRSRKLILDAAEFLFATKGYKDTSFVEIGEYANLSRATPTYFFENKENLYIQVLNRLFKEENEFTQRHLVLNTNDIDESLKNLLTTHIDFIASRPAYVQLMTRESLNNYGYLEKASEYISVIDLGKKIIAKSIEAGYLKSFDVENILMSSLAITWFPYTYSNTISTTLNINPFQKEFIDKHKKFVIDAFFNGIKLAQ